MLHLFLDDRPWFRAKRFGFGAGLPIAWQGWVLLAAHAAIIMGLVRLFHGQTVGQIVILLVAALIPMPLYRARTEGGWHWRSGRDEKPRD